jgi:hypothetical protein
MFYSDPEGRRIRSFIIKYGRDSTQAYYKLVLSNRQAVQIALQ